MEVLYLQRFSVDVGVAGWGEGVGGWGARDLRAVWNEGGKSAAKGEAA